MGAPQAPAGGQKQDQDLQQDQDQKPISGCCCCFVFRLYEGEALTRTGTRWCHQHTTERPPLGRSVCAVSHQSQKRVIKVWGGWPTPSHLIPMRCLIDLIEVVWCAGDMLHRHQCSRWPNNERSEALVQSPRQRDCLIMIVDSRPTGGRSRTISIPYRARISPHQQSDHRLLIVQNLHRIQGLKTDIRGDFSIFYCKPEKSPYKSMIYASYGWMIYVSSHDTPMYRHTIHRCTAPRDIPHGKRYNPLTKETNMLFCY